MPRHFSLLRSSASLFAAQFGLALRADDTEPVPGEIHRRAGDIPAYDVTAERHAQDPLFLPAHDQRYADPVTGGRVPEEVPQHFVHGKQGFDVVGRAEQGIDLRVAAVGLAADFKRTGDPRNQILDIHQ